MKPKPLYRSDIQQRFDRPTNSRMLVYTGRGLDFHSAVYGYPDGTFFVVNYDEVPFPESIEEAAARAGLALAALPDAPRLKDAVVHALLAEASVDAPSLLGEMADPPAYWSPWDLRELQRRHMIALARAAEAERILERDIALRVAARARPEVTMPEVSALLGPEPARPWLASVSEWPEVEDEPLEDDEATPTQPVPMVPGRVPEPEEEEEEVAPSSSTVTKATEAVTKARVDELPQRLPGGARRRLLKMPPGQYVAKGEHLEPRSDLCAAMTDAQAGSRAGHETAVIDWDGEWPVVVRRYGKEGRTVYRVESALRRHA